MHHVVFLGFLGQPI